LCSKIPHLATSDLRNPDRRKGRNSPRNDKKIWQKKIFIKTIMILTGLTTDEK